MPTTIPFILLYCLFAVFFLQILYYLIIIAPATYRAGKNTYRKDDKHTDIQTDSNSELTETKGVSVIVCARNEGENLTNYLHSLLEQDYPCFEVIVVNDQSEDDTRGILERMHLQYKNMRVSFVPQHAQLRSSKKLAITIGVKASQYDYILLTDADCRPESKHWIKEIMSAFDDPKTEVVLGYGAYFVNRTAINTIIQYDTLFNALQYMGFAGIGCPYMGVGRNLAYKKQTFFDNEGFKGLLANRAGDDDLFVQKVANGKNTKTIMSKDSITWSVPCKSFFEWEHQKERHLSVSAYYTAKSRFLLGLEPATRGLFYALLIATAYFGDIFIWTVIATLFLTRWLLQIILLNVAAKRVDSKWFFFSILLLDIFLPVNNLWLLLKHKFRRRNIEW